MIFDYEPKTFEDAVEHIISHLNNIDEENIKMAPSYVSFHHTIGRTIRNEWNLWNESSELHKHFKETYGLWHADDMSSMILNAIECRVKGTLFDPYKKAKSYLDYWANTI